MLQLKTKNVPDSEPNLVLSTRIVRPTTLLGRHHPDPPHKEAG